VGSGLVSQLLHEFQIVWPSFSHVGFGDAAASLSLAVMRLLPRTGDWDTLWRSTLVSVLLSHAQKVWPAPGSLSTLGIDCSREETAEKLPWPAVGTVTKDSSLDLEWLLVLSKINSCVFEAAASSEADAGTGKAA